MKNPCAGYGGVELPEPESWLSKRWFLKWTASVIVLLGCHLPELYCWCQADQIVLCGPLLIRSDFGRSWKDSGQTWERRGRTDRRRLGAKNGLL
jgi:hypothetical protein